MASPVPALYEAARVGNIAKLTESLSLPPEEINWVDQKGWTALHVAVNNAHAAAVGLLLKSPELDINKQGIDGETALSLAVEKGYDYVFLLFRFRCLVDLTLFSSLEIWLSLSHYYHLVLMPKNPTSGN